jgi:hypothetical protein
MQLKHIVDDRADYRKPSYASSGLLQIRIALGLVYRWSKYRGMLYSTKCPKSDLYDSLKFVQFFYIGTHKLA